MRPEVRDADFPLDPPTRSLVLIMFPPPHAFPSGTFLTERARIYITNLTRYLLAYMLVMNKKGGDADGDQ